MLFLMVSCETSKNYESHYKDVKIIRDSITGKIVLKSTTLIFHHDGKDSTREYFRDCLIKELRFRANGRIYSRKKIIHEEKSKSPFGRRAFYKTKFYSSFGKDSSEVIDTILDRNKYGWI